MSYLVLRQQRILENLNTHKIAANKVVKANTQKGANTRVYFGSFYLRLLGSLLALCDNLFEICRECVNEVDAGVLDHDSKHKREAQNDKPVQCGAVADFGHLRSTTETHCGH